MKAIKRSTVDALRIADTARAREDLLRGGFGAKDDDQTGDASELDTLDAASDLFARPFPSTPWLLRGLVTERSVACVGGEPKTTKTWAGLEMLMAIATHTPAFGEFKSVGPARGVVALLAEDSAQATRNRLRSLASARNLTPEDACRRIFVRNRVHLDVRNLDDMARVVATIRRLPIPVAAVLIDPLRDVIGDTNENDSGEMAVVMRSLRVLRDVLGATILFVHHSAKRGENTAKRRGGQNLRGSSATHGALDCGFYMSDLKTNAANEWTNKVEVEVKEARQARAFTLSLAVRDDSEDNGEAIDAAWTVTRGQPSNTDPVVAANAIVERVYAALSSNPDDFVPARALESKLKLGNGGASNPLIDLEKSGRAKWIKQGRRSGWYRLTAVQQALPTLSGDTVPALRERDTGTTSFTHSSGPSRTVRDNVAGTADGPGPSGTACPTANDDREAA